MTDNSQHVKWFRDSSPYINAHRHKTFVLYIGGDALDSENFPNIINDIVLLNSLGVRLVVVHGAAPQIDRQLASQGRSSDFAGGVRITTTDNLPAVQEAIGKIRSDIEARLSVGVVNSPLHGADIVVAGGNLLRAKPFGVREGVDFQHTGEIRRVNTKAIVQLLEARAIVLISPLGYSPSGEIFNINSVEVASEVATALMAEKLIYYTGDNGVSDEDGDLITELQVSEIDDAKIGRLSYLAQAKRACLHGVNRCHLISFQIDGALLQELFTRDGSGTQISRTSYEQVRSAKPEDVGGIIELIQPLEEEGILVKRPRERLESEISHFVVIERDGMIVSCAALYPFHEKGELACLATHPDYRDNDRGETLLNAIENKARSLSLTAIFVLTTHTTHWFTERGFKQVSVDDLPEKRKSLYNYQRNSKLFEKPI